ncbi:GGDEF domain-containing protein [Gordonia sinesedis]
MSEAERQYRLAVQALRSTGRLELVKSGIAAVCAAMVILGVVIEFHPLGPPTPTRMILHAMAVCSAGLTGAAWWLFPWPSYRWAALFAAWSGLSFVVSGASLATTAAQFSALCLLGLPGLFTAFLLGRRALAAYVTLACGAITAFSLRAMLADGVAPVDLAVYLVPAVYSGLVVPLVIALIIEVARGAIQRTVVAAQQDPLTGLYNRRSLYELAVTELRRRKSAVLVAAVIDVDRFKGINDRYGHSVGDAVIIAVSRHLTTVIGPTDLLGRIGGDEFAVIAFRDSLDEVPIFADRLHDVQDAIGYTYTLSIGVASQLPAHSMSTLDVLLRRADAAMYRAKTSGGGRLHLLPPA